MNYLHGLHPVEHGTAQWVLILLLSPLTSSLKVVGLDGTSRVAKFTPLLEAGGTGPVNPVQSSVPFTSNDELITNTENNNKLFS